MRRLWAALLLLLVSLAPLAQAQPSTDLPRRAQLGAQLAAATEGPAGLQVQAVLPGLSAEKLGLRVGDRITQIDGQPVAAMPPLLAWIGGKLGGAPARLTVLREGRELQLSGTLVERPREAPQPAYRVDYGHVLASRGRLRTLVSTPLPARAGARHPALLFIQGVTLSSVDFPLNDRQSANAYAQIVGAFARSGFVTMRVDKPGVGDSEGGPGTAVDFNQELDAYRAALKALLARSDVDPARVFIFGHSMGGLWGPVLAGEFKIKGIAVAGTLFRTWIEYSLENTRRQALLGGKPPHEVHDEITRMSPLLTAFFMDRLTPEQLRTRHPDAQALIDEMFAADGLYAGRAHAFWQQVNALNLPAAWNRASGHVLALWGSSDFIINGLDHELLAQHINTVRPGTASVVRLADSDHAFLTTTSQAESLAQWGKGGKPFNANVLAALNRWIEPLAGQALLLN
jgi:uncharacterized protein